MTKVLVTGAGGFIGSYLVKYLKSLGYCVFGVDLKYPEFDETAADQFYLIDLRNFRNCMLALHSGFDEVYNLAANMGGIGFIETHKSEIVHDNSLISLYMLEAAYKSNVKKFFYTSSACVYPRYKQNTIDLEKSTLKEEDAYPADPEDGYGWEKLYTERMCRHYTEDCGMQTRVVRFHNIFGPLGTYDGGREKSPAAICRKIALAEQEDTIEVWGDGEQRRSYCYIDDCVKGIHLLMKSDWQDPINLGTDRMISINQLVDIVSRISGKVIKKEYDLTKPVGVRGRNSDNTRLKNTLNWEPSISLEAGLTKTYNWIYEQVHKKK